MDSIDSFGVLEGKYRLLKILQKLPYSIYFLGTSISNPGRRWAIKKVTLNFGSEEEKSQTLIIFENTARKFGEVRHPLLNPLADYILEGGSGYLVFEFVPGQRLQEIFRLREKPFSEYQVIDFATQITDALVYLHDSGICFGDLNPSNIIITPEGSIKLVDYGLGKMLAKRNPSEPVRGTLGYAPPEQYGDDPVIDEKVDIFALGMVIYQMLTFKDPIDSAGEIPSARQISPMISREMDRIVMKAACKPREKRYSSAREILEDLRKLNDNQFVNGQEEENWLQKIAREVAKPFRKGK